MKKITTDQLGFYHSEGYVHLRKILASDIIQLTKQVLQGWVDEKIQTVLIFYVAQYFDGVLQEVTLERNDCLTMNGDPKQLVREPLVLTIVLAHALWVIQIILKQLSIIIVELLVSPDYV